MKKLPIVLASIAILLVAGFLFASHWYNTNLTAIGPAIDCTAEPNSDSCTSVNFTVSDGESVNEIATNLSAAGLIKSRLAFQIYASTSGYSSQLKSGDYQLNKTMSVSDLVNHFVTGDTDSNVFSFTILPGSTVKDIKDNLVKKHHYSTTDVDTAFAQNYNHLILADREDTSSYGAEPLEGYMYPDTYEFYKGTPVPNIITEVLDTFHAAVEKHNLVAKYSAKGLNFYEGLTLASIIQKEANPADQPGVAQVFLTRLATGMPLGSDVTTQYALNLVDPNRTTYTDNTAALSVDSPYNTRLYQNLPPGPISNPSLSALEAVANPTDTSYLYFLTGDDGKMYYSSTEQQHQQNIIDHCQKLCNVQL